MEVAVVGANDGRVGHLDALGLGLGHVVAEEEAGGEEGEGAWEWAWEWVEGCRCCECESRVFGQQNGNSRARNTNGWPHVWRVSTLL